MTAIGNEVSLETIGAYNKFITLVVPATPRASGRAQGNWRTSLRVPAVGIIGRTSGSAAIAAGKRTVLAAKRQFKKGRRPSIWIVNNLPYIGRLNSGSSEQAPAFFVEVAFFASKIGGTPARKAI